LNLREFNLLGRGEQVVRHLILALIITFFSQTTLAQAESPEAGSLLSFNEWKESQVLEFQNSVVRLSNRIQLIKTGRYQPEEGPTLEDSGASKSLPGEGFRLKRAETGKDRLVQTERELKRASERLQYAQSLSMDDYVTIYLAQYKNNEVAVRSLLDRLSKDELSSLLRATIGGSDADQGGDSRGRDKKMGAFVGEVAESRELPKM
jgi:hypothetical protein